MNDRLDVKINALVVELLDQPVEPPKFPPDHVVEPSRQLPGRAQPGWLVAAAVFAAVLVVGIVTALLVSSDDQVPVVDTTPEGIATGLTSTINAGDLEATLAWFAEDAQCVAPGLPTCEDLFGFIIAAGSRVVITECVVLNDPWLLCDGYMHTPIHDALGISEEALAAMPNFPPGLIVENGKIIQFNFMTPFTGDLTLDEILWVYLQEIEPDYINENGTPKLSAEIVSAVLEAAHQIGEQPDN